MIICRSLSLTLSLSLFIPCKRLNTTQINKERERAEQICFVRNLIHNKVIYGAAYTVIAYIIAKENIAILT